MPEPGDFLPLKNDVFMILLALAEGESYGYALMQQVEVVSAGALRLQPGALYRRLGELAEAGLIAELEERVVESTDERRRYYALTALGRQVARAEARRMEALVAVAAARRLLVARR